jgi:hypothetical protein
MQAYHQAQGKHKDISSQALQKQVKRFRQKHHLSYRCFKSMARREYGKPELARFSRTISANGEELIIDRETQDSTSG